MALGWTQREIEDRLTAWGLLRVEGEQPAASKNRTVLCRHSNGKRVLVKIADGLGNRGVIREGELLERLLPLTRDEGCPLEVPSVFAFDRRLGLLALEWLPQSETFHRYHRRTGRYGEAAARQVGRALAYLHRVSLKRTEGLDRARAFREESDLLECFLRLRPDFFARLSRASLAFFARVQRDGAAHDGLELAFRAQEQAQQSVLLHGDMRQANLLRVSGDGGARLVVLDWELAFWGDGARDLGSLLADYALGALAPEHEEEALSISSLHHFARALLSAYRQERERGFALDREFRQRVVWWTGVALLIYVFGITHYEGEFSNRSQGLTEDGLSMLGNPARWPKRLWGGHD